MQRLERAKVRVRQTQVNTQNTNKQRNMAQTMNKGSVQSIIPDLRKVQEGLGIILSAVQSGTACWQWQSQKTNLNINAE